MQETFPRRKGTPATRSLHQASRFSWTSFHPIAPSYIHPFTAPRHTLCTLEQAKIWKQQATHIPTRQTDTRTPSTRLFLMKEFPNLQILTFANSPHVSF